MVDKQTLNERLIELLAEIEFDSRYYAMYESLLDSEDNETSLTQTDYEIALAQSELDFVYRKRENFFLHKQTCPTVDLELRVAFPYGRVEFILTVWTEEGAIGGPFPRLARLVGLRRDADFSPLVYSPKLPLGDKQELQKIISFGVTLFEDAKLVICAYDGWQ